MATLAKQILKNKANEPKSRDPRINLQSGRYLVSRLFINLQGSTSDDV